MDTPSSFDVPVVKAEEELPEEPRGTSKSLPYNSLLVEIHALYPQHELWNSICWWSASRLQEIWSVQHEAKLQQMIFMLLQNQGVRSQSLRHIQTVAETEAEQIQNSVARFARIDFFPSSAEYDDLKSIPKFLETSNQKIKPHLKEFCLGIVDRLLQGNSSATADYSIFTFVNVILLKLKHFMKFKPNLIDPWKKHMRILEEMLNYAAIITRKLTVPDDSLHNFFEFFKPWVNTAAAIVIPYWVDENNEKPFAMVSSSLERFNLNILQYIKACILVIKALRPSNASEILVMRNTVEKFIEMILEKFNLPVDDCFDIFREGLAFWTALLVNPPEANAEHEKLICSQTRRLLDQAESLIFSLCPGKDVAERRNTVFNDFLEKIKEAKIEVRQLQVYQIPGLSWNNAPKVNTRGHFDDLLRNLLNKFEVEAEFLPFEKHLIAIVHKELLLLRPYLFDIFELQDEHEDLRDIWVQASNIAFIVDYISDFCLSSADIPIWSNLMHLSNAIEKIQSIKTQVSKISLNDQMYDNIVMSAKLNAQLMFPKQQEVYDATANDDFKVGFVVEEQRIIDFLVAREAGRNIAAIVGMGGQGKTHLARRVFQSKRIKHHFYKLAWCCISQAYDVKMVFRDILEGVGENVSLQLYQSLTQEDLAEKLRKCLMGQKYLVVLDDIWDAKAWFDLELSFPDNRNGSRILLTSRNLDVVLKMKANCSIVELHPLSHEDSWNLLQMKVFHGDSCPPDLFEIGKTVAKTCKGLPLAVVVVAGLLKNDKTVESWNQISESLKSLIASEGCMDIVELSYKHLPDYLKPCFLYLGAFREDQIIDAEELIQFWIAEGFVQSDGIKTKEVVAEEYLMDLASRSLIFVAQRSSRNGIEKCFVHDLLHQLCQIKVQEERFLLVLNEVSVSSSTLNDDYCRIIVDKPQPFVDSKLLVPSLRSLLVFWMNRLDDSYTPIFLKTFKLVRVLDLLHAKVTQTGFDTITQLIHLRLLGFVCDFPIPPSMINLCKLEVLRFHMGQFGAKLTSVVTKMPSLRHIFALECNFDFIDCYDQLVPHMSNFSLANLETLTTVRFRDLLSFKRVAQSLQNILNLGFQCKFCVCLSSYFRMLESLKLDVSYETPQKKAISPSILDFPVTLKILDLRVGGHISISGATISSIGKLNNLEVLKLKADFENDRWEVEDDEFLQLKYFDFRFSSVKRMECIR